MEIGSALIGLVIVGLCALPFLLFSRSRKNKEKQFLRSLDLLAEQKNCHLDAHELSRDFAIGIDQVAKTAFFYKNLEGQETKQFVRLNEVDRCELKIVSRNLSPDRGGRKVIDRIALVFIPVEGGDPVNSWIMYSSEENIQLAGELQLAERWKNIFREALEKVA